ncbi:MAG TPA: hypothetical protein VHR66_28060, partial [Gemmataceae bacterium]|nr:hypothetical protein [Gemmataceae bacterium]
MRQRKASLGLERLDTRDVPACVVSHGVQNTMEIIGDGAPDTVIINDNGTGLITGSATGWGTFVFSGIDTIKVNTWAGDDA